jgi:hypothetical protein
MRQGKARKLGLEVRLVLFFVSTTGEIENNAKAYLGSVTTLKDRIFAIKQEKE